MTEPTIEIQGLKEIIDKLGKVPPALQAAMNKTMATSLQELQATVARFGYPPKPAASKYRRTGTLGRSIGVSGGKPTVYSITGTGTDIQGRFGTDLSYAKYVIDAQQQAYMHKGWWWDLDVVKNSATPKIQKFWARLITKVKQKLGLS